MYRCPHDNQKVESSKIYMTGSPSWKWSSARVNNIYLKGWAAELEKNDAETKGDFIVSRKFCRGKKTFVSQHGMPLHFNCPNHSIGKWGHSWFHKDVSFLLSNGKDSRTSNGLTNKRPWRKGERPKVCPKPENNCSPFIMRNFCSGFVSKRRRPKKKGPLTVETAHFSGKAETSFPDGNETWKPIQSRKTWRNFGEIANNFLAVGEQKSNKFPKLSQLQNCLGGLQDLNEIVTTLFQPADSLAEINRFQLALLHGWASIRRQQPFEFRRASEIFAEWSDSIFGRQRRSSIFLYFSK